MGTEEYTHGPAHLLCEVTNGTPISLSWLLGYREPRLVRVDEGILVFEGSVVCEQPGTMHHFGLDAVAPTGFSRQ